LRCSLSETKHRLFIGNVPKTWTEDDFRKVIEGVGPGVENIELIKVQSPVAVLLAYIKLFVRANILFPLHFVFIRTLKIQVGIVDLLLFCITIMHVLIIHGKRCQMQALSWMAIPPLSHGQIQRTLLIIRLLHR